MPATQRGHARRLPSGKWQLRYYGADGNRRTGGAFPSKTAALDHYRHVIEPTLNGSSPRAELTFAELADVYLARHAQIRSANTIRALRERLARPLAAFGDVPLRELEGMSGDIADFRATLPPGSWQHDIMRALRQTCAAGVRYGHMARNPAVLAGENPQPPPRPVRVYSVAELDALEAELGPEYGPIVTFAAATGLRPQEWLPLERRDVDRARRLLRVERTSPTAEYARAARRAAACARCRSPAAPWRRSNGDHPGWTRRCCSPARRAGRSTWTSSAGGCGDPR